jgi:DNA-binding CsgD family transcriptional regulator
LKPSAIAEHAVQPAVYSGPNELRNDVVMAPERELRIDLQLDGTEAQLLDPRRLGLREVVVAEVLEGCTSEQPERLGQQGCLLARRSAARIGQEPLESMEVELVLFEPKRVAGVARRDAVAAEQLPQRRDVTLHGVAGSGRRPGGPERVDGFVHRDQLAGPKQQEPEQRPLLPASRRSVALAVHDLQPPQEPELHLDLDCRTHPRDPRHHSRVSGASATSCSLVMSTAQEVSDVAIPELSPVELQIVRLVAQGRSRRDIADELGLSLKTVDWHVARGRRKLQHAATLHERMQRKADQTVETASRNQRRDI